MKALKINCFHQFLFCYRRLLFTIRKVEDKGSDVNERDIMNETLFQLLRYSLIHNARGITEIEVDFRGETLNYICPLNEIRKSQGNVLFPWLFLISRYLEKYVLTNLAN